MFTPHPARTAATAAGSHVVAAKDIRATLQSTATMPSGKARGGALPDSAAWSRFTHSASVVGVMTGIAIGLWAAPTLAHWETTPGLRSATLTAPVAVEQAEPAPSRRAMHWMHVSTHDASSASDTTHAPPPAAVPDRAFAVPRGDLRKDISNANRSAAPSVRFGGH